MGAFFYLKLNIYLHCKIKNHENNSLKIPSAGIIIRKNSFNFQFKAIIYDTFIFK